MAKQRKIPTIQDTRKSFMAVIKDLVMGDNPRQEYDPAAMKELMVSMRHSGCMEPVLVRAMPKGVYRLVGGYRRVSAATKLGWDVIDAIEVDVEDEIDEMLKRIEENAQRVNPSLPETGRQFIKIIKMGRLSAAEISARTGCSREFVEKAMDAFRHIPKQFHDRITYGTRGNTEKAGTIPATVALSIASVRKDTSITQADTEKLMKWASEKGVNIVKTRTAARMISAGVPVAKAIDRVDYMRTITLSFVMNINKIKLLQHKYGMDIHDILYTVLEAQEELGITANAAKKRSGKTPSALLVKKRINRKEPKR